MSDVEIVSSSLTIRMNILVPGATFKLIHSSSKVANPKKFEVFTVADSMYTTDELCHIKSPSY